jgi:hypothetical protein
VAHQVSPVRKLLLQGLRSVVEFLDVFLGIGDQLHVFLLDGSQLLLQRLR